GVRFCGVGDAAARRAVAPAAGDVARGRTGADARVRLLVLLAALSSTAWAQATLDKPPKLQRFVEAEPPASLAERHEVSVVLTIDIAETGRVVKIDAARWGGAEYDDAAVQAARQFVFSPGEAGGKPVPVRITYEYKFLYKPPPPPPVATPEAPRVETVPVEGRVLR